MESCYSSLNICCSVSSSGSGSLCWPGDGEHAPYPLQLHLLLHLLLLLLLYLQLEAPDGGDETLELLKMWNVEWFQISAVIYDSTSSEELILLHWSLRF